VVRPYVRQSEAAFPVAVDTADIFGMAFGLKAIPVSYLVDEVGIVRLKGAGPSDALLKQIEEVLGEPVLPVRSWQPQLPSALSRIELERALEKNPDDWRTHLDLARVLGASGQLDAAKTELEAAAKLQPDNAEVPFTWATMLLARGERDQALAQLKRARDLDPENWRIRKQIWAIEHPDKIYSGQSPDYVWQKEELARERAKSQ